MLILSPLSTVVVFYSPFQMDTDKWQRSDNINITSNPVEAALADIVTVPVPPPSLQTYETVQVRFAQSGAPQLGPALWAMYDWTEISTNWQSWSVVRCCRHQDLMPSAVTK